MPIVVPVKFAFAARELWGESAHASDTVHLDLWEDYLDAA